MRTSVEINGPVVGTFISGYHQPSADHNYGIVDGQNKARENVEKLVLLQQAAFRLEQKEVITPNNMQVSMAGTIIEPGSFPLIPTQSVTKLQDGSATVSSSAKRQGRGALNRQRAERMALQAMAALVQATSDLEQWGDDYSPQDLFLLEYGDEELGLGGCVIDPDVYLLLWEVLAYATPRC